MNNITEMSRSVQLQVRKTIELLCCIFKDNGMTDIQAETLRKAKFDKDAACAPLWRLLFEIVSFCQHGLDGSTALAAYTNMSVDDRVRFVKKAFQKRGYLSRSLATLPTDMSRGSRELLLAMAWLLNNEDVLHKFMDNRASPLHDDVISLYESLGSEEGWNPPKLAEKGQSAAQRVQQMLVLNTKLKMNLRLLLASQQEYATLTHRIHNSTYGVSLSPDLNHLTTMQVQMLRHPQHMKRVLLLLEQDSVRLENLLQWQEKESVFWEWMESVLELKQQAGRDGAEGGAADPATRTVFLDLPPSIGADIAQTRRNLMSMVLHYESAIERLEDLWATKRSKISELELNGLLAGINAEITQLQACIGLEPEIQKSLPLSAGPRLVLVKNSAHRGAAKVSNAQAACNSASSRQQESAVPLHQELSRLQQEADVMEKELMGMRRHCLQKLNSVISGVPNTICVVPPRMQKCYQ